MRFLVTTHSTWYLGFTFAKTFEEKTFVGKLSNLTMSCRRSVEKGHYKSEDYYIDGEELENGKKKTVSVYCI